MPESKPEWFADDALWAATYSTMFPESRLAQAPAEIERILALVGQPPTDVLDLACGPGRHSVLLAQRGLRVTAVDRSPFLLEKARRRAADRHVTVEWIQQDMREFVRPDAFDLALSLFTSFGFFRNPAENQHVLENVHMSLRPGGSLVMDMMGKEILARIFTPTSAQEIPEGLLVQRRQAVNDWSMMYNQWILLAGGRQTTFELEHWLYSGWELRQMLEAAGFHDIRLFGNLEGDPYGPAATRLVALARKAAG